MSALQDLSEDVDLGKDSQTSVSASSENTYKNLYTGFVTLYGDVCRLYTKELPSLISLYLCGNIKNGLKV